jgi:metacaspase-1
MKSRALLVGINDYRHHGDLRGCLNDVENIKRLLLSRFEFKENDIDATLLDAAAIRKSLRDKLQWLSKDATTGDRLVFFYAGHGAQIRALDDGDEEEDLDEIFCMHDMSADPGSWSDKTYIRDNELQKWIRQLPKGIHLTVITDSCHSGTATRMVQVTKADGRVVRALEPDLSLARGVRAGILGAPRAIYVPDKFKPSPAASKRSLRKRMARSGELTYLHLAACHDSQFAYDAEIDGKPCGAFTYHLCRELDRDPTVGAAELVRRTHDELLRSGFSAATPQFEGIDRQGGIFGPGPGGSSAALVGPPGMVVTTIPPATNVPAATDLLYPLVRQFIQVLQTTLDQRAGVPIGRNSAGDVLICVHGIGRHQSGFSQEWWDALSPHVGDTFGTGALDRDRFEVVWSDIVNDMGSRDALAQLSREEVEAKTLIHDTIEDRTLRDDPTAGAVRAVRGNAPEVDDFVRYMFRPSIRRQVLDRFHAILSNPLVIGKRIHLMSHSWGTVVAHEGLLEHDQRGLPAIRVANFFTIGAALSIPFVRWKLGLNSTRSKTIDRWINIDNKGDAVGGSIATKFPSVEEYLGLVPMSCSTWDLGCCHSAYFDRENLTVNRHILAAAILNRPIAIDSSNSREVGVVSSDAQADLITRAVESGQKMADTAVARARQSTRSAQRGDAGLLLAEGDSWFDYPFHDVLKRLESNYGYDVESDAKMGHTVEAMAFDGQFEAVEKRIRKIAQSGRIPKAFLLSGGGNDVAGAEFAMLLNHALSPSRGLDRDMLAALMRNRIAPAYAHLVGGIDRICKSAFGRSIPIIIHGYDYAVPDGRGWAGGWWKLPGPWLEPSLRLKGFESIDEGKQIVSELIKAINEMVLPTIGRAMPDVVRPIDLRGILRDDEDYREDWANELHPTRSGFDKIAARFHREIQRLP